jgi:hypothetical protein
MDDEGSLFYWVVASKGGGGSCISFMNLSLFSKELFTDAVGFLM